jgi:hypothetical protein
MSAPAAAPAPAAAAPAAAPAAAAPAACADEKKAADDAKKAANDANIAKWGAYEQKAIKQLEDAASHAAGWEFYSSTMIPGDPRIRCGTGTPAIG